MRPIRILHRGFDNFEVSFQGGLRPQDIRTLEKARQKAQDTNRDILVKLGPGKVSMHVAESGARGGYAFRCDTGPFGATWFFKRNTDIDQWNIRVSFKSLALALDGLDDTWRQLKETLDLLGANWQRESIGRIDYAVDFLMPREFKLKPENFIAHSNATGSEHSRLQGQEKKSADYEVTLHWQGRKTGTYTIGKMPGLQLSVYDKRREVLQHQKFDWFAIWGVKKTDASLAIWRVELRAAKKHLKDWNITSYEDARSQIGDVLTSASQKIRYVIPIDQDSNISRWPLHPLWKCFVRALDTELEEHVSGAVRGRIRVGKREEIHNQYIEQIVSLFPGAIATSDFPDTDINKKIRKLMRKIMARTNEAKSKEINEKMEHAKSKWHFT